MTPALPARPRALVPEDLVRPRGAPGQAIFRAAAAVVKAAGDGANPARLARECWPRDETVPTVLRAASGPADTTTSGWASQLVQTQVTEWVSSLQPSVFSQVAPLGISLTFGGALPRIPIRDSVPTIAGSFVAEGAPIPVRRLNFASAVLRPKKMAVITTFSAEIAQLSAPNLELILRGEIVADSSVAIDSILLDANPATAVRPAGLRAGVTGLTATAGGGFAAMAGDLKGLLGAISPAVKPAFIMNPVQAISVALTQNEVGGALGQGMPVIQAPTVPVGMVFAIDAAAFTSASDLPAFSTAEEGVIHEEDNLPLAISTPGSPNVVASPGRSLYQTNVVALKMTWPLDWTLRRTGAVAFTSGVTW